MNNITKYIASLFPAPKNVVNEMVVKNLDIYFFSTNWCPHSPKAIENFKEFVLSYNDQIINGYKINCIIIDCSDHDNKIATDLIKSMNIEFYPCVKMLKDEEIIAFEGKIIKDDVRKKLYSILNVTII